jgi:hypothetical protein
LLHPFFNDLAGQEVTAQQKGSGNARFRWILQFFCAESAQAWNHIISMPLWNFPKLIINTIIVKAGGRQLKTLSLTNAT